VPLWAVRTSNERSGEHHAYANIRAYGGDRHSILQTTGVWEPDLAGVASIPGRGLGGRESVGTIQAGGITRIVDRFSGTGGGANILVTFTGNNSMATMVTMHELGHVLGYWGHSPNSNDVMRATLPLFSPNETLNPAEIEHLRQIYRTFRN